MSPSHPDIRLERPSLDDRPMVYRWMTAPGIVERMMGPPTFPEMPVPDYATFLADHEDHLWTHDTPEQGRLFLIEAGDERVGCIIHNDLVVAADGKRACEIDLWLAGPEHVGRGYGRKAIVAICEIIAGELDVELAFLQPSARNPIACAAYAGAGFARSPLGAAEAASFYRTKPDYPDSLFFIRKLK